MEAGKIIRLLRTMDDLSQSELAKQTGVSRSYLSLVETGEKEPGLAFLKKIAEFFDIPLTLLIPGKSKDPKLFKQLQKIFADILVSKTALSEK